MQMYSNKSDHYKYEFSLNKRRWTMYLILLKLFRDESLKLF